MAFGNGEYGPWRDGRRLVTTHAMVLPDYCVKCNAPAGGFRLTKSYSWHSPWLYLLTPLYLVIYIIVAAIMRKTATITFGLCRHHRRRRVRAMLIGWAIGLFAIAQFCYGVHLSSIHVRYDRLGGIIASAALLEGLVGGAIGIYLSRTFIVKRIDRQYAWFKGACDDFLNSLPPLR